MNKISILGSGWLGQPLAKHLQHKGNQINLSTRSKDKANDLHSHLITPHLIDIECITGNLPSFLQAKTLIINITCKDYYAYQALVREIEKSPVKNVLFISSTSVYPNNQGDCKESDPLDVETNLRKIEKLFFANAHFQCSVIRFAGLIGPKRHPGRFFASGKQVRDGEAKVNLIHLDDCIGLIDSVIEQSAWGEVFNGCADNHPNKKTYYSTMATALGYPEPVCLIAEKGANKVVCNEKVKKQLGYQFIYPDIYQIKC